MSINLAEVYATHNYGHQGLKTELIHSLRCTALTNKLDMATVPSEQ